MTKEQMKIKKRRREEYLQKRTGENESYRV